MATQNKAMPWIHLLLDDSDDKRRITLDPVTRIEGHLRIETETVKGKVTNAWSTGTLFRGVEIILKDRNPEDAWLFTQRLCGVCTYVHGSASVRCVEDALGINIPDNARIIRNLLMGVQYLHDHIVHFYHLHALDWVDIVSALSADPAATEALAESISPDAKYIDFAAAQSRLQSFVNSGQLGPFNNGYWGHPAYILSAEENLLLTAHYLEALHQQAQTARMHAIFGAKNPHLQSLQVGGVTCKYDLTTARIAEFRSLLNDTRAFIDTFYIPDVLLIARRYTDWVNTGATGNFLACGEFPKNQNEPASLYFPQGVIFNMGDVEALDESEIMEHVAHSWYEGSDSLHPSQGETRPGYTGLDTNDRYSWLKAPRYLGNAMEVGPLARILVAYKSGQADVKEAVDNLLGSLGLSLSDMNSTLGRTAARALETQVIAWAMEDWLNQLNTNGDTFQPWNMPETASGWGLNEAPRGALGHWIQIQNKKIGNYQLVVPSTWNFGPRCSQNKPGPAESALVGTSVVDPERPVEILRTVHSFDPCIACAVHVIDTQNDRVYEVKVT
jgi:[NiFe] hydrogenase large subunit